MPRTFRLPVCVLGVVLSAGAAGITAAADLDERQAALAAALELTEEQGRDFWPVYREYRDEMNEVERAFLEWLAGCGQDPAGLNYYAAEALLDQAVELRQREMKVWKRQLPKLRRALPARQLVEWLALEQRTALERRLEALLGGAPAQARR